MKRKLMITALIAAVAMPAMAPAAMAQTTREVRRDREQLREERGELRRAERRGDPRQIREERRDVRDARRDVRDSVQDRNRNWGSNEWRGYRDRNRGVYSRGGWRAPFRYNGFRAGVRIAPQYYGSRYFIADPWRYRLPPVRGAQRWVRHYDDMLLVDTRRGVVIQVIRNFFW